MGRGIAASGRKVAVDAVVCRQRRPAAVAAVTAPRKGVVSSVSFRDSLLLGMREKLPHVRRHNFLVRSEESVLLCSLYTLLPSIALSVYHRSRR